MTKKRLYDLTLIFKPSLQKEDDLLALDKTFSNLLSNQPLLNALYIRLDHKFYAKDTAISVYEKTTTTLKNNLAAYSCFEKFHVKFSSNLF